jgi:hypothetical protein
MNPYYAFILKQIARLNGKIENTSRTVRTQDKIVYESARSNKKGFSKVITQRIPSK